MSLGLPACELGDHGHRGRFGPIEVKLRLREALGDHDRGDLIETNTCSYCLAEARKDDRVNVVWSSADE